MEFLRQHVTFANLVASLALFVALGGTSYATIANRDEGPKRTIPQQPTAQPSNLSIPVLPVESGGSVPPADQPSPVAPDVPLSNSYEAAPAASEEGPAEPPEVEVLAAPESREAADPQGRRGNGHGHRGKHADREAEGEHGGGPPPWAPAHGYRCREAGNSPGSDSFKACVKAPKP